jgi:hypothetical protein
MTIKIKTFLPLPQDKLTYKIGKGKSRYSVRVTPDLTYCVCIKGSNRIFNLKLMQKRHLWEQIIGSK